MNKITINGVDISVDSMSNVVLDRTGNVIINGKTILSNLDKEIRVVFDGVLQLNSLKVEGNAELAGTVSEVEVGNNASIIGNISGGVAAGNNVSVSGNIGNNVNAGNNISAVSIAGNAVAGNKIVYGK